jgi:hypothetical protein
LKEEPGANRRLKGLQQTLIAIKFELWKLIQFTSISTEPMHILHDLHPQIELSASLQHIADTH